MRRIVESDSTSKDISDKIRITDTIAMLSIIEILVEALDVIHAVAKENPMDRASAGIRNIAAGALRISREIAEGLDEV